MYIKKLSLAIGPNCFTNCLGCYNNFENKKIVNKNKKVLTVDEIINFVKYLRNFGLKQITISGGDPLTYPYLITLLKKLKKLNLHINMDTLGLPFSENTPVFNQKTTIQKFDIDSIKKYIDIIGIPLDGVSSTSIHNFRGSFIENIFEKILTVLTLLNKNIFFISINTVVHKQNIRELNQIFEIITQFKNIKKIQLFQFSPIGQKAFLNRNHFFIQETEFKEACENLLLFAKTNGINDIQINYKSSTERQLQYIIVNSAGYVFLPEIFTIQNEQIIKNDITVLGNICNTGEYSNIISSYFKNLSCKNNISE